MSVGRYLSLGEARKKQQIACFCKKHPSKADRQRFSALLDAMAAGLTYVKGIYALAFARNVARTFPE